MDRGFDEVFGTELHKERHRGDEWCRAWLSTSDALVFLGILDDWPELREGVVRLEAIAAEQDHALGDSLRKHRGPRSPSRSVLMLVGLIMGAMIVGFCWLLLRVYGSPP